LYLNLSSSFLASVVADIAPVGSIVGLEGGLGTIRSKGRDRLGYYKEGLVN